MQDSNRWQPIHENHAIDVMAVKVGFAQPIPMVAFRKLLRVAEAGATEAGLTNRQPVNSGIVAQAQVGGVSLVANPIQGQSFSDTPEAPEGQAPSQSMGEQLHVDQTSIIYRTWRYVSWTWHLDRLRTLVAPVLDAANSTVANGMVQLEYLDRFRFDGSAAEASVGAIVRQSSPFVAPHVFSKNRLWHSHTGSFLPSADGTQRLELINVDAVAEPAIPQAGTVQMRWLNVLTMRRDTFASDAAENGGPAADSIFGTLATMHTELKDLLAAIITDEMATRIYLRKA